MGESRGPAPKYQDWKFFISQVCQLGMDNTFKLAEHIYGNTSHEATHEFADELEAQSKEFWEKKITALEDLRDDYVKKIDEAGQRAIKLERALGLVPQVEEISNTISLIQIHKQLSTLLEQYEEIRRNRVEEYSILQHENEELCSVLDLKGDGSSFTQSVSLTDEDYIPTSDDINKLKKSIEDLKKMKEELIDDFEDTKKKLKQLLLECVIAPLTKEERFACGIAELEITKANLTRMRLTVDKYNKVKDDMVADAEYRRDQIRSLSKKLGMDQDEIAKFLSEHSGYSQPIINKLNDKIAIMKEERQTNLKELIAKSREVLTEWWNRCWYSQTQRDEFKYFNTDQIKEEVLEFHEYEIELLELFYNQHRKIFSLANKHEELWERLLHLEDLSNDKDRLFKNRGGCLLQEERERKVIQKKLPEIKSQLIAALDEYKKQTGKDFMQFGEPLKQKIIMKEEMREFTKHKERMQRKIANAENVIAESHLGVKIPAGVKRKAVMTPTSKNSKPFKTMRYDAMSPSTSTISSKSAASSCVSTYVVKEAEKKPSNAKQHLREEKTLCLRTPRARKPLASTPKDGSLSYESFIQDHIEKSKSLAHNSTRNNEQQRVLRPRKPSQSGAEHDKHKTPKTPNMTRTPNTTTRTPNMTTRTPKTTSRTPGRTLPKTPSRIPFRIPTGSKIPSQVPLISPRQPLPPKSKKLPIIF